MTSGGRSPAGLKTLADAEDLRNRIYGAFEQAERCEDPVQREQWLTFVVIGGGPTGVELAGELAIIATHGMKRDFTRIDPRDARVILLDAGERLTAVVQRAPLGQGRAAVGRAGGERARGSAGHCN